MMANLVLELKAGELLVINGATIRFRNRVRVELLSRARFLFGKQIMAPHEATSPARQIYYALQVAYEPSTERLTGRTTMTATATRSSRAPHATRLRCRARRLPIAPPSGSGAVQPPRLPYGG